MSTLAICPQTGCLLTGFFGLSTDHADLRSTYLAWARSIHGAQAVEVENWILFRIGDTDLNELRAEDGSGLLFGELYHRSDLREALIRSGCVTPPSAAETGDLFLAAYRAWGGGLTHRLDGLYAAVLYEPKARRLTLCRDASCARGLYYARRPGALCFGTRLDLVVGSPLLEPHLDRAALHEYLRFLDISPPQTLFANVDAAELGVCLRFDMSSATCPVLMDQGPPCPVGGADESSSSLSKRPVKPRTVEEAAAVLEGRLVESLRERLGASGRVGVLLSGGLDSTLICSIAAELAGDRCEAVTVGFDDSVLDERPAAAAIACRLGIRHHALRFTEDDDWRAFEALAGASDLPFADPAVIPSWLLFEHCAQAGFDLVLDGTGADTLLGVMPARYTRLATEYMARLPRRVRAVLAQGLKRVEHLRGLAPLFDFDDPEELLIRWKGWTRREIEQLVRQPVSLQQTRFYRIYASYRRSQHFERYSALLGNLPDDRVHQCAACHGVKVRFPFWDRAVESCVQSLPKHFRYGPDSPKRLLKLILARRLPSELWDRPKHGFDFPFQSLMRSRDHALLTEYLDPDDVAHSIGLLSAPIASHRAAFIAGDDRSAFRLWGLVVLRAWMEHHAGGLQ